MWTPDSLDPDGPRYLAVVARIQRDVASGSLRPGMQLPPQRELASRLGMDLTTISRAYTEARRRGLVTGHVGRGTFVRAHAATLALSTASAMDDSPVDLSLNLPPASVLEEAERALATTLRELPDSSSFAGLLEYQPNAGRTEHREAGAEWVARRGLDRPASQIVVTAGAQHALTVLLMSHAQSGTTVMAEALTYPVFKGLAEQLRLDVVGVAMDDEGLSPDAFRAACRAGGRVLYCTPTLQNPTTAIMSHRRRQEIAEIAAEFEVVIIEDDTYGLLPREAPPALTTFAPERSFFVGSLSKTVAAGLRVAYVAAPSERAARQIAAGVRTTSWMATPLTAEIAARWIRDGIAGQLLAANQAEANVRQRIAADALAQYAWRAHPDGYHGWLHLPDGWSTAEFVMHARRQGVVVTPGDAFAVGREPSPMAVRLSLAAPPSHAALERAVGRLSRLLETGPDLATSLL